MLVVWARRPHFQSCLQGGGIMNPSINLLQRLLTQGRRLIYMGRLTEARRRLEKLLAFPEVSEQARVEAHQLLADIHLDNQCYRKARRHLVAALGLHADSAQSLYQLAVTLDLDPDADPKRAAKYYRKALELKPDEARYWSSYGQVCLRLGKEKAAYGAFVAAADLASMDVEVIDEITEGFCFLGREEEKMRERSWTAAAFPTRSRCRTRGHSGTVFRFLQPAPANNKPTQAAARPLPQAKQSVPGLRSRQRIEWNQGRTGDSPARSLLEAVAALDPSEQRPETGSVKRGTIPHQKPVSPCAARE